MHFNLRLGLILVSETWGESVFETLEQLFKIVLTAEGTKLAIVSSVNMFHLWHLTTCL